MTLSSKDGATTAAQQQFLREVVTEMEGFRAKFEPLLAQLSSFDNAEAQGLMSRSLETLDVINNIINLQDEVGPAPNSCMIEGGSMIAGPQCRCS